MEEELGILLERAVSMGLSCDDNTLAKLRQVPLSQLSRMMNVYLTHDKDIVNAVYVLGHATTKRDSLTDEEAEVMVSFFSGKLSSFLTVEAAVTCIALVIEDYYSKRPCSKTLFAMLSEAFLQNIGFQSLSTKVRRCGYRILIFMVSGVTLPWFTTEILRSFLEAMDEESEPELLMRVLEIHSLLASGVDRAVISPLLDDYFDSISSYFPIVFSQPRGGCQVTREELKDALTRCMTRPLYVDTCISFLLSRLSSPSSVVKQEAITVLLEIFSPCSDHTTESLNLHVLPLLSHVRNEIIRSVSFGTGADDTYTQRCMNILGAIAKRAHGILSSSFLSWLEPITSGAIASLISGHAVCSAYATMLYHLASGGVCCGTGLAQYFLPLLLMNLQEIDADIDDALLILSAVLTGIYDLRAADEPCIVAPLQIAVRKSMEASSSALFKLTEKILLSLDRLESHSLFIRCELLSSVLVLSAWLRPWMPDETAHLSCRKLLSICLSGDEEVSRKISNCISRIARVEGNAVNHVLLKGLDDVEPSVPSVVLLYRGLLSSSLSTSLLAIEILLNRKEGLFTDRIPEEKDVFSLCRFGLSTHGNLSDDVILHLLSITAHNNSIESFEFLCDLLERLSEDLHGAKISQMVGGKLLSTLSIALLSSYSVDILDVTASTECWVMELINAVCNDKLRLLAMQGISAMCTQVPSVSDIFLEKSGEANPRVQLTVLAAVARGLLGAGVGMNGKMEWIMKHLFASISNGVSAADDALTATFSFSFGGSKKFTSLLLPFLLTIRKSTSPIPIGLVKILVQLLKTESPDSEIEWCNILEFVRKLAREEPAKDAADGIVEFLDIIISRIDSKDTFVGLFVTSNGLLQLVLSGVVSLALQTRCTALHFLTQIALFVVHTDIAGDKNAFSNKNELMKAREEVLSVAQSALADQKRVVRRAAAQCRHQWYKIK